MVALNKRIEKPKSSYTSKLRSAAPTAQDNDTARIKACIDTRAPTYEIVEEAYRLCRIIGYIRKDLRKAKDDLRSFDEFKKRQAVREDALEEMREALLKTQKMLERTWNYLEHRSVKVPADMKAAYKALKTPQLHDWQPQKGLKNNGRQPLQGKNSTKVGRKQKQKAKKKASEHQTTFLLHTDDGATRNLRDPVIDSYTDDDDTDIEAESPPAKDNGTTADESSKQLSELHEQIVDKVVAWSKPDPLKTNPFASLKIPKVDAKPARDAACYSNSTIYTPIVEGLLAANTIIAGVKRKNTSINGSIGSAMKKARLDLDLEEVKTGASVALDRAINSETTVASEGLNHHSTEEMKRSTPEITAVAPTTAVSEELEEGEINE